MFSVFFLPNLVPPFVLSCPSHPLLSRRSRDAVFSRLVRFGIFFLPKRGSQIWSFFCFCTGGWGWGGAVVYPLEVFSMCSRCLVVISVVGFFFW